MRPSCEDAVLPLKALGTTSKSGEQVEEHPQRSVDARETERLVRPILVLPESQVPGR